MSTEARTGRGKQAAPGPSFEARRWRRALPGVAALLWLLAAGWGLGSYPLTEPDEGRNGTAAFEVATEGRWLLPTYDGLELLDKPLLWFDAAALALRAFGVGELGVRLPSLLFTAATVLLVVGFARRLYGPAGGWVAGAALGTSPLVLAFARIAIFDPMLVFFMVAALVLFHEAVERGPGEEPRGLSRRWCAALAWLAMALGVLTKGPVAVAVPLLVALPYALWRRRGRALWSGPGAAVFGTLVAGWGAFVESRVPGYFEYVALTETWGRLTSSGPGSTDLGSSSGVRSLVPVLLGGSLPWSVVAAWAWLSGWRRRPSGSGGGGAPGPLAPSSVYLALWLVVPSLLFELAEPKRLQYVLPLVPAVALLLAAAAARARVTAGALRAGAVALALPGLALLAAGSGVWPVLGDLAGNLAPRARSGALVLGLLLLAAPAFAAGLARRRPVMAGVALALPGLLLPLVLYPVVAEIGRLRSSVDLAVAVEARCAEAPVVGIDVLPSTLPFYLRRPIGMASETGRPFQSHYVEVHWESIVAREGSDPRFTRSWWDGLPPRAVAVFGRRDQVKRVGAELHGFAPLAANRLYEVWSRGCG
jgi:4-amino-4-deoxy-L-arabinose transferase-like glycosyltransferase